MKTQIQYPHIAEEIIRLAEDPNQERLKEKPDFTKWGGQDRSNTRRLREIIKEIGWPTIPKVGEVASNYAWLLAQHADRDLDFQEEALELIKNLSSQEILKKNIAYLTDRILVAKGLPQRYATQFYQTYKEDRSLDKCILSPVEDPERLSQRLEEMEMKPFENYLQEFMESTGFKEEYMDLSALDFHHIARNGL